jgi:hypothetical protein
MSPNTVGSLHIKALEHILKVLCLIDKGVMPKLLDLKPKKVF